MKIQCRVSLCSDSSVKPEQIHKVAECPPQPSLIKSDYQSKYPARNCGVQRNLDSLGWSRERTDCRHQFYVSSTHRMEEVKNQEHASADQQSQQSPQQPHWAFQQPMHNKTESDCGVCNPIWNTVCKNIPDRAHASYQ